MSKTVENVIVVAIMIAIVACLLCFVGYDGIKDWLSEPIIWKEHSQVTIQFVGKIKQGDNIELHFNIYNSTDQKIQEYNFLAYVEGVELDIRSRYIYNTIDAHSTKYEVVSITKDMYASSSATKVDAETYNKILIMSTEQLDVSTKTVYLRGEDGVLVENNGTWKIIAILVASLVLGILGLVERFPVWLRITFKVCSLPIFVCLIVLFLWASNREEQRKKRAQQEQSSSARPWR